MTKDDRSRIEAQGKILAVKVRLALTGKLAARLGDAGELAGVLLSYGPSTATIVLTFSGSIHAVGARTMDTTRGFFDPNTGPERDETQDEFMNNLDNRINAYHGWNNEPTSIWTLAA